MFYKPSYLLQCFKKEEEKKKHTTSDALRTIARWSCGPCFSCTARISYAMGAHPMAVMASHGTTSYEI